MTPGSRFSQSKKLACAGHGVGAVDDPGELQSPRQRGQVHVFGQRLCSEVDAGWPKNGPDPDFAVLLAIYEPKVDHPSRRPIILFLERLTK